MPSAPPISRGACASLRGASVLRYHMDTFTSLLPRMACGLWAAPGAQHNQLSPSPFCISSLDLPLGKPLSFLWFPGRSRVRQRQLGRGHAVAEIISIWSQLQVAEAVAF